MAWRVIMPKTTSTRLSQEPHVGAWPAFVPGWNGTAFLASESSGPVRVPFRTFTDSPNGIGIRVLALRGKECADVVPNQQLYWAESRVHVPVACQVTTSD